MLTATLHWILIAAITVAGLSATNQSGLHRYESVEPYMGTLVKITLYASDEQAATKAFRASFDRIGDLDRILSDYKPDSELNQLATTAVGRAINVSDDLFTVLAASQELAAATGGAFDVTQGPVIRLWREARRTSRVPDAAALKEAASRGGYQKLHLDAANQTARLDRAGMALDVGAIGKGYAASEALAVLGRLGVRSALVAVSGDLAFSDAPPGERGWRIDIHADDPALAAVPRLLELTNAAVSSSGNSQQHLDTGEQRYSHVIDPASGMGLTEDITVTVIAPTGLESDGLDTAASVLGPERGLALIESRPGVAAIIIRRTRSRTEVVMSSRFREHVASQVDRRPHSTK